MNVRDWFEQELARIREVEARAEAEREAQSREAEERANALLEAQQREEQQRIEEALALQYAQEERERAENERATVARAEAERQVAFLEEARRAALEAEAEAAEIKDQEVKDQAARAQAQLVAQAAERAQRLEIETRRIEAERLEAERLEAERLEAERLEAERLEAERLEAERLEAERLEAERLEAERLEAERLEAERLEAERLEAERLEAERLEAERLEAERLEAALRAASKQLAAEQLAAEQLAAEQLAAEQLAAEQLAAEQLAAEQLAAEQLAAEQLAAEQLAAEQLAAEQLAAEQLAAEQLAAEQLAAEQLAAEQLAAEQLAAEQLAAEQLAAEQLAAEQLAAQRRAVEEAEAQKLLSAQFVTADDVPEPALLSYETVPTVSSIAAPESLAETDEFSQSEPPLIMPLAAAYPIALAAESHEGGVLLGVADLHCHLLPAWDDGARDLETSLEMVRRAGTWGCEAIVVTPHVGKLFNFKVPPSQEIGAAVVALREKVAASSQKTRLVPGAEIALSSPVLLERILNEPELSVGGLGRHALIEPPSQDWPEWMEMAALQLLQSGVTPILAHPERFPAVQRNPAILGRLVNTGALVQITADAIVGHMGRHSKRCTEALFGLGLVALIASDAHDARATLPSEVADEVKAMVGIDAARRILRDNPLAVLAGEVAFAPVIAPPIIEEAPRGLLSGLWSRH